MSGSRSRLRPFQGQKRPRANASRSRDAYEVERRCGAKNRRSARGGRTRRSCPLEEGRLRQNRARVSSRETCARGEIVMEVLRASSFWRDLKGILDYVDDVYGGDVALRFLEALDGT